MLTLSNSCIISQKRLLTFPPAKLKLKKSLLFKLNLYNIFSVNRNKSATTESSTNSGVRLTKKLKTTGNQPTKISLNCIDKAKSLLGNPPKGWIVTCPKCDIDRCFVKGGISKLVFHNSNIEKVIYHPNTDICCSGIHAGVIVSYIWFIYHVAVLKNKLILNP